jgi:hypothetical protein
MGPTRGKRRPGTGARRFGYLVAVAVNAVVLYLATVRPGWEAVPVLTADTEQVMGWVVASIVVSIVANLVYLAVDTGRLRALGDLVTTGVGLGAIVRVWQVFPFDFGDASFDWALLARVLLVVAMVGSAIALVVALVRLVRGDR